MATLIGSRRRTVADMQSHAERVQGVADAALRRFARLMFARLRAVQTAVPHADVVDAVTRAQAVRLADLYPTIGGVEIAKAADDPPPQDMVDALTGIIVESAQVAIEIRPRLDIINPYAIALAQRQASTILRSVDATTLSSIQAVIARAANGEMTVQRAAKMIEATVGLAPSQIATLTAYEQAAHARLERGARALTATERARWSTAPATLRGRASIDRNVDTYARTMLRQRAQTIARTETMRAANYGQRAAWNDAANAGLFDPSKATIRWYTTSDDRACSLCIPMDGKVIAVVGGQFVSNERATRDSIAAFHDELQPGGTVGEMRSVSDIVGSGLETKPTTTTTVDMPPLHPRCRCTTALDTGHDDDSLGIHAEDEGDLAGLIGRWEDQDVDLVITEKADAITLHKVVVPESSRGGGVGSAFMDDLTAYADRAGKRIDLTPSTDFGATSVARLKRFYAKHGFVENKGRNADYAISQAMYRLPTTTAE